MHQRSASRATWSKLLVWLNCRQSIVSGLHKILFLRAPTGFCQASAGARLGDFKHAAYATRVRVTGSDKYSTVHVKNKNLVEFRGFQSSLNPLTILRNIEVVESLLLFMQWIPFHAAASTDLATYGRWLRWHGGFPYLNHWILHRAANSPLKQGFLSTTQE